MRLAFALLILSISLMAPQWVFGEIAESRQVPGVSPEKPSSTAPVSPVSEDQRNIRDPFRRPKVATFDDTRSDLERYPVSEFKMVGVLKGVKALRAMLLTPDGKTYFVSERMKIGPHNGVIRKINEDSIKVREKVVNILGEEENIDSELWLQAAGVSSGSAVPAGSNAEPARGAAPAPVNVNYNEGTVLPEWAAKEAGDSTQGRANRKQEAK